MAEPPWLRALAGVAVVALAAAPAALALPEGSTFLVSRPDGAGPLATPLTNHSSLTGTRAASLLGEQGPRTVSDDGRYVVFVSAADGLSSEHVDTVQNVYVRDRQLQVTTLVSRADGVAGAAADGDSLSPTISRNGRYVAFASSATNLSSFDEGGVTHVYVRDLIAGTTRLMDRADGASGVIGNEAASSPALTVDGGQPVVAFASRATNLVATAVPAGISQVYLRDDTQTILVSRRDGQTVSTPNAPGNLGSSQPSISEDGSAVAFTTAATNLADLANNGDDDVNGVDDVYVRVLAAEDTSIVSLSEQGAPLNGDSGSPSISGDGSHVAFTTAASDATDFTGADPDDDLDVYVRGAGTTRLASRATGAAGASGNGASYAPALTDDETRVAFASTSTNLDPGDATATADVYLRRLDTSATSLVSTKGGVVGDGASDLPAISADGQQVAFETDADNLSPDDEDDFRQVMTRYVGSVPTINPIVVVSQPSGSGVFRSGVNVSFHAPSSRNGTSVAGTSTDGRYVVFVSAEDDLVADDDDRFLNVYVRDTLLDRTILVSRAGGAAGAAANGDSGSLEGNLATTIGPPGISADGTRVVFASAASNLVPDDTNGVLDVFVRDLAAGTTVRVSLKPDGTEIPEGGRDAAISAAGNRVAFVTAAALDASDTNGSQADVYVRDLAAGTTTLVSRQSLGGVSGNAASVDPVLDADGSRIAFTTAASNFAPMLADGNGVGDVYLHDLDTGTTSLVSARAALLLQAGNASSGTPSISADGQRVAFTSSSGNLVSVVDGNAAVDVYLRDFTLAAGQQTILVSRTSGPNGIAGNGEAKSPSISADGTRIAFQSSASDLVPGDANGGLGEVFVRDVAAATTQLVSHANGAGGAQPPAGASVPALSPDGDCVTFASTGDALVAGTTGRDFARLYVRAVRGECGAPLEVVPPAPPPAQPPPAPPAADTTPPRLSALTVKPARFRAGARVRAARKGAPAVGASIRFALSEAATVRLKVERLLPGVKVKKRCVAPKAGVTGPRCVRAKARGTLTATRAAGTRRLAFTGTLRGKRLAPGRYRLTLTATDAAGNVSRALRRTVVVLP
ncbi:MAG: hypothetical protein R3C15_01740 [Thermoleophilia bacterium]